MEHFPEMVRDRHLLPADVLRKHVPSLIGFDDEVLQELLDDVGGCAGEKVFGSGSTGRKGMERP
jgi:hypothetical protein